MWYVPKLIMSYGGVHMYP